MSDYLNEQIGYQVQNTADWRRRKAEEFPNDERNRIAAEYLERLGKEIDAIESGSEIEAQIDAAVDAINALSDEDDDPAPAWSGVIESVSDELRAIGFHTTYMSGIELLEWYRDLLNSRVQQITRAGRNEERRVRRLAIRNGYRVHKSRAQRHGNNFGEYMLISDRNVCVIGSRYDASLTQIEDFLG